ncbi:AAA ATPase afg3, partial [Friedmanniomyces endolithicus]
IGYVYYPNSSESSDAQFQKPFSEQTAQAIDGEVRRIVDEAYMQCKQLLMEKKKEVGIVAEELLALEVLGRDDMIRLLGPRPFEDRNDFTKIFGTRQGSGADGPMGGAPKPTTPGPNGPEQGDGGAGGATLPPGLGRAPEEPAPTIYKALEDMAREWRR